ncbi:MAG: FtsQ-type POTRA domain-containing protein [Candidatus Nanopelagicaceae bacterium]|nr:FtsQ-type POTRA domain-containing protein [Candidatus Nanopelagicaceae bacterium]
MNRKNIYLIAAVVLVSLLAYLLGWSGLMNVDQIKVAGVIKTQNVSKLSVKEIIKLSGIKKGQPMARVNSSAVKRKLLAFPQILDVKVNRQLPGTVVIDLKLRKIEIAVTAAGGGYLVGDSSGVTFAKVSQVPRGIPIIRASTSKLLLRQTLLVFHSLPPKIQNRVISIDAKTRDSITFNLTLGVQIVWGGTQEQDLKIEVLNALLADSKNKRVKIIDISSPLAPTVR